MSSFEHRIDIVGRDGASAAFRKAGRSADGFLHRLTSLSQLSVNLGRHMRLVGRAVGALGDMAVKAGREFAAYEKAMSEVASISNFTTAEFAEMDRAIKKFSVSFGVDAVKAANSLYQTVSAGSSKAAAATAVMTQSLKFAKAAVTEPAAAVDLLTTVLNSYGLAAGDVTRVSDLLFTTIRLGKTTGPELAASIGRVAPAADKAGVSLEDLAATMAMLTKVLKTDQAATGMAALLKSITQATPEAARAIADLNLQFFNEAALSEPGGIFNLLRELNERGGDTIGELGKIIPESKALMAALVAGGNEIQLAEVLEGIGDAAGATERALAFMTDDFDHQMNKLTSAWQVFQIDLFATIGKLPVIERFVGGVIELLEDLSETFVFASSDADALSRSNARMTSLLSGLVDVLQSLGHALLFVASTAVSLAVQLGELFGEVPPFTKEQRALKEQIDETREAMEAFDAKKLGMGLAEALGRMNSYRDRLGKLKEEYSDLQSEQSDFGSSLGDLHDRIDSAAEALRKSLLPALTDVGEALGNTSIEVTPPEGGPGEPPPEASLRWHEFWADRVEDTAQYGEQMGDALGSAISNALVDHSVSWKEQFTELGENTKSIMLDSFLEPLTGAGSAVNDLFTAALTPINALGQAVNDLFVKKLVDGFLKFIGVKTAAEAGAGAAAVGTQATTAGGIAVATNLATASMIPLLTTAAVAASIASFGGALAFGPPTIAAIAAAAGTGSGIAAAAALPIPKAEGGRITERGIFEVGERGEELILPETRTGRSRSLLHDLYRRRPELSPVTGGRGGAVITLNVSAVGLDERALADLLAERIDAAIGDSIA